MREGDRLHLPSEGILLDIGEGVGALVIYTKPAVRGQEIEISRTDGDGRRIHTEVLERVLNGQTVFAAVFDAEAPFVLADIGCGSVFASTFGLEVLTADGLSRESSLRAEMPALDAGADGVLLGFIPRSFVFAVDAADDTRLAGSAAASGNLRLRCVLSCATAFTFASRDAATLGPSEAAGTLGALDGAAINGACDGAGDSAMFGTRAKEDFAATFAGPAGIAG